jgi:hypothetical protein
MWQSPSFHEHTQGIATSLRSSQLRGRKNGRPRLVFHGFRQGSYRAKHHAPGLAMLNAGRFPAAFYSVNAEVAEASRHWNKIGVYLVRPNSDQLMNLDTDHTIFEFMFLFTGDFAGMAAGAPIVLYQ